MVAEVRAVGGEDCAALDDGDVRGRCYGGGDETEAGDRARAEEAR